MIPFNWFAEVVNRAPTLVVGNPNYVKKIVFPLPILSWVSVLAALFHALIGVVVLVLGQLLLRGSISPTLWMFPLIWLPLGLLLLGFSFWLSALAVYLRDIGQVIAMSVTVLMFLSPLFYPTSSLPPWLAQWAWLNPMVFSIEATRQTLLWGQAPAWSALALQIACAAIFAAMGHAWFHKAANGFGDVL